MPKYNTIKEAILQSLEDLKTPQTANEICEHILKQDYAQFSGKTPEATTQSQAGDFIRKNDQRIKRLKNGGSYVYYLSKYTDLVTDLVEPQTNAANSAPNSAEKTSKTPKKSYLERDLHKLFSTYLHHIQSIYSKTIFHENSTFVDKHQIWTHPDMVGIHFLHLKNTNAEALLHTINREESFTICAYELKRSIHSDTELKECFFQAVSNSSWANKGYLVTLELNDNLMDEMARLNQAFGIGIIQLAANPFESKILFESSQRSLDFITIDKLSNNNKAFEAWIKDIQACMTASSQHKKASFGELTRNSDDYFSGIDDVAIKAYCQEKNIPWTDLREA